MKHTQGNWYAFADCIIVELPDGEKVKLAEVCDQNKAGKNHWQANAKLIAAAPELLTQLNDAIALVATLRQEVDTLSEQLDPALLGSQPDNAWDSRVNQYQQAINKATL